MAEGAFVARKKQGGQVLNYQFYHLSTAHLPIPQLPLHPLESL